jgi:hypothetical protein
MASEQGFVMVGDVLPIVEKFVSNPKIDGSDENDAHGDI